MLTRTRIAASAIVGSLLCAALGVADLAVAPAASATPARTADPAVTAIPAAGSALPASAKKLLASEMAQAWHITKGAGVTVAVLSTSVDTVTGLTGKVTTGPDYAPLAGAPAIDGTLLASMIAASGSTGSGPFGTTGRAPGARILSERVVDWGAGKAGQKYLQNDVWEDNIAKAIRYAVRHGASVIVSQLNGYADTSELDSAVAYAISHKVVVLGGEGAFGSTPNAAEYPDSLPGVINFSGTQISGLPKRAHPLKSPLNNSILVTAPDNQLPATGPGSAPYTAWGSFSTQSFVAGTVALIKSAYPGITPAQVADALAQSASFHPAGGYNTTIGFGLINPIGALREAAKLVKTPATAAPGPDAVGAAGRFGQPVPAVIDAVHHSRVKLAGGGAAIVAGLILLLAAVLVGRRRRKPAPVPVAAVPGPPPGDLEGI